MEIKKPISDADLRQVKGTIRGGGIVAFPTESVYGLSCDPFNEDAVKRLMKMKHRDANKGFILIASNWEQVQNLVHSMPSTVLENINKTWPGPHTWVFPARDAVPPWISGAYNSVAIRIPAYHIAHDICHAVGHPLISSSANLEDELPCNTGKEVQDLFGTDVNYIVYGEVGGLTTPTDITDAMTGEVIRP